MPKKTIHELMTAAIERADNCIQIKESLREKRILDYLPSFEATCKKALDNINRAKYTQTDKIALFVEMLIKKADIYLILSAFSEESKQYEKAMNYCIQSNQSLIQATQYLNSTLNLKDLNIYQYNISLIENRGIEQIKNIYFNELSDKFKKNQVIDINFLNTFFQEIKEVISNPESLADFFHDVYENLIDFSDNIKISIDINITCLNSAEEAYEKALASLPNSHENLTKKKEIYYTILNIHFYKLQCYLENAKPNEAISQAKMACKYIDIAVESGIFNELEVQSYKDDYDTQLKNIQNSTQKEIDTNEILEAHSAIQNIQKDFDSCKTQNKQPDKMLEKFLEFGRKKILGYGTGQDDVAKVGMILARIFRNPKNILKTFFKVEPNSLNKNSTVMLYHTSYEFYISASKIATSETLLNEIQKCLDFIKCEYGKSTLKELRADDFKLHKNRRLTDLNEAKREQEMDIYLSRALKRLREIFGSQVIDEGLDSLCSYVFKQYELYAAPIRKKRYSLMNTMANLDDPFGLNLSSNNYLPNSTIVSSCNGNRNTHYKSVTPIFSCEDDDLKGKSKKQNTNKP